MSSTGGWRYDIPVRRRNPGKHRARRIVPESSSRSAKHGKNLNWLFELRDIGDYGTTVHVPREDAKQAVEAAQLFIEAVKNLLTEKE